MPDRVVVTPHGKVVDVMLNQPGQRNALSRELLEELLAALSEAWQPAISAPASIGASWAEGSRMACRGFSSAMRPGSPASSAAKYGEAALSLARRASRSSCMRRV